MGCSTDGSHRHSRVPSLLFGFVPHAKKNARSMSGPEHGQMPTARVANSWLPAPLPAFALALVLGYTNIGQSTRIEIAELRPGAGAMVPDAHHVADTAPCDKKYVTNTVHSKIESGHSNGFIGSLSRQKSNKL
jgi:hypothetical protein